MSRCTGNTGGVCHLLGQFGAFARRKISLRNSLEKFSVEVDTLNEKISQTTQTLTLLDQDVKVLRNKLNALNNQIQYHEKTLNDINNEHSVKLGMLVAVEADLKRKEMDIIEYMDSNQEWVVKLQRKHFS